MKSTVVDESLSSFKPMYCSREYQASTRLIQQYEKSTLNYTLEVSSLRNCGQCFSFYVQDYEVGKYKDAMSNLGETDNYQDFTLTHLEPAISKTFP